MKYMGICNHLPTRVLLYFSGILLCIGMVVFAFKFSEIIRDNPCRGGCGSMVSKPEDTPSVPLPDK